MIIKGVNVKIRHAQQVMKAIIAAPVVSHSSECTGKASEKDPTVCCKGTVKWMQLAPVEKPTLEG
jgi:hypothetical protein